MAPVKDKWIRRFIIPETTRHKKGFTIYKVTSLVFLKTSREEISKVSVWKRYNDFKKLHIELGALHTKFHIKEPFPLFPKSKFFGRFETEVIEERRHHALQFLDFVGKHSCLYSSDIFIKFFETSYIDNSVNDCSQSISSDTSEDDHLVNVNNTLPKNSNTENVSQSLCSTSQDFSKYSHSMLLPHSFCTNKKELIVQKDVSEYDEIVSLDKEYTKIKKNECKIDTMFKQEIITSDFCPLDKNGYFSNKNVGVLHLDKKLYLHNSSHENNSRKNVIENSQSYNSEIPNECTIVNNIITPENESRKTIHDGSDLPYENSTQYILIAAAHMSAGYQHEAIAEYEEAFTQYKMGISNLLIGVQTDLDNTRAAIVKEKISKYLQRAEKLYNRYLNCNISVLNKPISELKNYKVLKIIDTVMLVKDIRFNSTRIIKTIEKSLGNKENISNYILRGQIPYMTRLYACVETETTIFLILEYAKKGKLWNFITAYYKSFNDSSSAIQNPFQSLNCINNNQIYPEKITNNICKSTKENQLNIELQVNDTESTLKNATNNTLKSEQNSCLITESNGTYCSNVPTTQLLEKAQKLLQSVNATLKKSNSVASRLNESKQLMYQDSATILNAKNAVYIPENTNKILENDETHIVSAYINNNKESLKQTDSSINNIIKNKAVLTGEYILSDSNNTIASLHNLNKSSYKCIDLNYCIQQRNNVTDSNNLEISNKYVMEHIRHVPNNKNCDNIKSEESLSLGIQCNINCNDCLLNEDHKSNLEEEKCIEIDKYNALETKQELWKIPEDIIRLWAAEIVLALEALHQQDVIILDLKPENLLLDDNGHIQLTYIVPHCSTELTKLRQPYNSPELHMFLPTVPITSAADIWNFGVILYELLTGIKFKSIHSEPFNSHSAIIIPSKLSKNAKSLLFDVLKYEPRERLTIAEIKNHPFFQEIDWSNLMQSEI